MKIVETGILNAGETGGRRAVSTFPSFAVVGEDTLLTTYRVGSTKDCDDENVELRRSTDNGRTWGDPTPFPATTVGGMRGGLKLCYLTLLRPGHLIAAAMWVNHEMYPGKPLFNTQTEGCLPMSILLADSHDSGRTWSPWRVVPMPEEIGPPSLTNPILRLADGTLAMSIETNKPYEDKSPWFQRVVYLYSKDGGKTWSAPVTTAQDPSRRIFYWDQRAGVAPNGTLVTFSWTYDRQANSYLNIHRNSSRDNGRSCTGFQDLRFADQGSHPAILPDGRIVIAWVDRFQTASIRARLATGIDAPFLAETEVVLYEHKKDAQSGDSTGELLEQMGL